MVRRALGKAVRLVGVTMVILSVVHTPLPQPDYHNVRHHDAPGEVCEYHDHLLRWHPGAGVASDVAVLHWHWFLPSESGEGAPSADGAAIHAHVPAWLASTWDDGPQVAPDTASRILDRPAPCVLEWPLTAALPVLGVDHPSGIRRGAGSRATIAPAVSIPSLLQRWDC